MESAIEKSSLESAVSYNPSGESADFRKEGVISGIRCC